MKQTLAILILTMSATLAVGQKIDSDLPHAKATLTIEQCTADARLWRQPQSVKAARYDVLLGESDEMTTCLKLAKNDVAHQWLYLLTDDVLATVERDRLQSFVTRRSSILEFTQEDLEGKR